MSQDNGYRWVPSGFGGETLLPNAKADRAEVCPRFGFAHDSLTCSTCLRLRLRTRRLVDDEENGGDAPLPEMTSLTDLLAEPDEDDPYLIEQVWPIGNLVLSAYTKAGKTTLRNNTIRSLVDGDDFLGTYSVPKTVDRIVLMDLEMSRSTVRRWLGEQGITNTAAVDVIPMRGQGNSLRRLDRWVERFAGADVVLLDCLEPALHALGLDPQTSARKFLEDLGAATTAGGANSTGVLHHHGHGSERAKGDSGILAWPDAFWNLVLLDRDNPSSPRYFSAYGRDVDVPESLVEFDEVTRRLTILGGVNRSMDRARVKREETVPTLLDALRGDHTRRLAEGETPTIPSCSVHWKSKGDITSLGVASGLSGRAATVALNAAISDGLILASKPPQGHRSSGADWYVLSAEGLLRERS